MKTMTDHQQLLAEYVQNGSDAAFRELVGAYIDFVYSTALRLTNGNTHLAEEVTQMTFIRLARDASKLSRESMLGGWLHRTTCFVASNVRRGEQRRRVREQEAALMNSLLDHSEANLEKLAPVLDEAINQLGNDDRNAILLRFYEQRDFKSVGDALGSNEDAARRRVARALEKLHGLLERQGITLSTAVLGSILGSGTVTAAPPALIGTVTGAALTSAGTAGTAATFIQTIAMAKVKTLLIAPILIGGIAGVLLVQNQQKLRALETELQQKQEQIALLQKETPMPAAAFPAPDTVRELLQLRGEVGVLKRQLAQSMAARATLPADNEPILNEVEQKYMQNIMRQQYLTQMRMTHAKNWMLGFIMHANDHNGQLPTNFSQARKYIQGKPNPDDALANESNETMLLASNDFQIVYNGSLDALTNNHVIVLMSSPQQNIPGDPSGGWTKVYGFADGSAQRVHSADGNFDEWEKANMAEAQTSEAGR